MISALISVILLLYSALTISSIIDVKQLAVMTLLNHIRNTAGIMHEPLVALIVEIG
jgi:hypothetical protein